MAECSKSHRQLALKTPTTVLPGGSHQSLEIIDDESDLEDDVGVWPESSPPPLSPSTRMSDAPVLSINIAGPTTLSVKDRSLAARLHYPIEVTISYDAAPGLVNTGTPTTFHISRFKAMGLHYKGFQLYVKKNDEWIGHEVNGEIQHHVFSSSPSPVNVGKNEDKFQSLVPGESCSFTREVSDFPKNLKPGDQFRTGLMESSLIGGIGVISMTMKIPW